jgi:lipopolysaccharide transport protein LptA
MKKILLIIFLISTKLCFAEPFQVPKIEKEKPLRIRADKVDMYRISGEIYFIDNVRAEQGEMTILSQEMLVKYSEDSENKFSVNKIFVEGGANLLTQTVKASGNSGEYDFKQGLVFLRGDVIANEQGVMAYGDEFIYNVDTKKTKLFGNRKKDDRVIIILDDVDELQQQSKKKNQQNNKGNTKQDAKTNSKTN